MAILGREGHSPRRRSRGALLTTRGPRSKIHRMLRWAVILGTAAAACGGISGQDGAEPPDEAPGPNSDSVFSEILALAEVPDDSALVHVRGDPDGYLDEKGRSARWILLLASPSEKSVLLVDYYDSQPHVEASDSELVDCFAALPISAPPGSAVLVPEMEGRYAPIDPFPETKARWTARFYNFAHPCLSSSASSRVSAIRSNPETREKVSFHYDYSWDGALIGQCEACPGNGYCCP